MNRIIVFICIAAKAQDVPDPVPPPSPAPATTLCDPFTMQTLPTLSFKQRACYWRDQLLTGNAVVGAALWGAVGEWRHQPPEWPQGFKGFGEQFGTRYTQGMVKSTGTFLTGVALAKTPLRDDPRPLPPSEIGCYSQPTTVWPRLGLALARVVWTRDPHCKGLGRPAFSRVVGSFASGFVALAWEPPSRNNLNAALTGSGTALAGYFGDSVFTEFQGDLYRLLGKIFMTGKPKSAPAKP